ncbi:MAG: type II toxin-antitoxin system VapC family toxin [Bryobacterales bacterium]
MKLLLDTHVWLWALSGGKLRKRARRALEDPANELWLSPVSLWEATQLYAQGRMRVDDTIERWIEGALREIPCHEAFVTNEIAMDARSFALPAGDTADRLLGATARVLGLTLMTADPNLLACEDIPTARAA